MYVEAIVCDVTNGDVTTVALDRVDRLIVVEPKSTTSLELLARVVMAVDVATRDVTVDPSAFVVVTSIEVGTVVVEGAASVVGVVSTLDEGVVFSCAVVGDASVVGSVVGVVSC